MPRKRTNPRFTSLTEIKKLILSRPRRGQNLASFFLPRPRRGHVPREVNLAEVEVYLGFTSDLERPWRTSFTRSEIFGNMCCFFRQQTQHLLPSLGTGSPKGALWEFVGKVIFSLFDPKNRFSAFNGPINIAGGRLDILFHFPNDWYNNIEGKIEKIKIDFLP